MNTKKMATFQSLTHPQIFGLGRLCLKKTTKGGGLKVWVLAEPNIQQAAPEITQACIYDLNEAEAVEATGGRVWFPLKADRSFNGLEEIAELELVEEVL